MKRIIMFVLLFAALKVAGQTTGYLRFDTVKIMKQNGTCELYIINKTKDSLGLLTNVGGGLTRFIKPKVLNDSTLIIGLDTLVIPGATGSGSSGPPSLTYKYNAYGGIGGVLSPGEAAYTYDSITNTLYVDTINLKKAITDTVRFRPSVLTPNGLRISANGDSYTVGTASTDFDDSSYIGRTSNHYNMPADNLAVSGSGAINAGYLHFVNVNYPHTYMTTLMTGLNNLRISGGTDKNYRKIVNAYKNLFCNHFSKTFYPASNTTHVTRHGSWTTGWASNSGGGKGGVNGAFTATANDSIKYNFNDSTVWFSVIAGDGSGSIYTSPDIDVYIDNVLIENYNLNNQTDGQADGAFDGRLTPIVRYYTGLTYGAHTIKIVNKANLFLLFDGFGNLVDRNSANTYVGYHVPKMTAAGYATAPANSSDAITNTINAKLDSLFATFPSWFPAFLVPVNTYYLPNSGDVTGGVDDVHPNDQGHRHIFDATIATLGNGPSGVESGTVFYALGNLYLKNDTGVIVKIIAGDVVYNQGQTILNDTMRIGSHNAKPVAIISNGRTVASFIDGPNVLEIFDNTRIFGKLQAVSGGVTLDGAFDFTAGVGSMFGKWSQGGQGFGLNSGYTAVANSRYWGSFLSQNGMYFGLVADDNSAANVKYWLEVKRNGTHADSVTFPMGKIYFGEMTRVASADSVLTWDVTTQQVRLTPKGSGADGNGIYGGSGTLPADITVSTGGFTTTWTGTNDSETSFSVVNNGTTNASAISGTANGTTSVGVTGTSGSYIGVFGSSTSSTGVQGQSSSGVGVIGVSSTGAAIRGQINPSSTNAIENAITILRTTSAGAGANGLGAAIQFELETATSGTSQIAGSTAFKWTDATNSTRTSAYEIYGVNSGTSARKAAVAGNGQWTWDGYGAGTHTGTPTYSIQSTSSGAIIEGPLVASGTYTPTLTGVTNVTGTTAYACQYMRVGNVVTVSGKLTIDYTATGLVQVGISLPIASAISNDFEVAGTGSTGTNPFSGAILGDDTNNRAQFDLQSSSSGGDSFFFTFTYQVL